MELITITRKLEWDMGHTVTRHESKCKHLHGHRYTAEIVCAAKQLDSIGRVIDFGEVKKVVGTWIDDNWDHKFVIWDQDPRLDAILAMDKESVVVVEFNPTAENLVAELKHVASGLLAPTGISVVKIRLFETPNGWADAVSTDHHGQTLVPFEST